MRQPASRHPVASRLDWKGVLKIHISPVTPTRDKSRGNISSSFPCDNGKTRPACLTIVGLGSRPRNALRGTEDANN
ncbi:unnamed protein product [Nesidiocoris tenuis]|uniref:Uncharacterized protein n=1 Tax=Nesidiocoris tenuis TaxID=355587 RepID=A0A6H5GVM0_9HEMI|nr:unnamed protein product [Nesidiocoris tenuis]